MKKASAVLYLIGAIFAILEFVSLLSLGLVVTFVNIPEMAETLREVNLSLASAATLFFVEAGLSLLSAVCAFIGVGNNKKGKNHIGFHIFALVISVVSANGLLFLAALFGILGNRK